MIHTAFDDLFNDSFYYLQNKKDLTERKSKTIKTNDGYSYVMEIPGYGKEDVSAEFESDNKISFVFKEKDGVITKQTDSSFLFSGDVDVTKISIKVENGLLKVFLPFKKKDIVSNIKLTIE